MIKSIGSFTGLTMKDSKGVNWVASLILVLYAKAAVSIYHCQNFSSLSIYTLRFWFKVLWNLSTRFELGLYAGVWVFCISRRSKSACQILFSNSIPWLLWFVTGHPNLVSQLVISWLVTTSASSQGMG